jgi:hypothetical protein
MTVDVSGNRLEVALGAQSWSQDRVDIVAQRVGVNTRQPFPRAMSSAALALRRGSGRGDCGAVTRDDYAFTALHTVQHFSLFVAEVARSLNPWRRRITGETFLIANEGEYAGSPVGLLFVITLHGK